MYKLGKEGDAILVTLDGSIDENFSLDPSELSGSETIIFDFNDIESINSSGIRTWTELIDAISGKQVIFRRCRKIVMNQLNTVALFAPDDVKVESFYIPYFCEECNERRGFLVTPNDVVRDGKVYIPDPACPKCRGILEFDAIEKKYFKFIK